MISVPLFLQKGTVFALSTIKTTVMKLFQYISILFLGFSLSTNAQFINKQKNIVDVQEYKFTIGINDDSNEIAVAANIKLQILQKTDSIYLDLDKLDTSGKGMKLYACKVNQKEVKNYKFLHDKIIFYHTQDWHHKTIEIEIQYKGIPKDGLYISKNKYGKRTFFGDNWPNRAHYWLPVIDHPSDKAKVKFTILAPKHYKVVATGSLDGKDESKNLSIWYFHSTIPISTKVMVFAAADFKIKEFGDIQLSEKSIPISSWIYKESPDEGFDDYRCAVPVTKFYDSLIGPYSYEKLANVQSKTRFGGMENAGNIFYYEASVDGKKGVENLVAHEIAHQWFGNSVSEQEWSDIWLSEGFATYLTDVYLEHKYGKQRLKERMEMERKKVIRFNKYNAKPIVYEEKNNLMRLLNPNSYEKGAWVLHMLRRETGDKDFFKILRAFYKKYRNSNASTSDFINIVNKITQKDYHSFFKQWLKNAGVPKLKMAYHIDNNKLIINVTQLNDDIYKLKMPVKIVSDNFSQQFTLDIHQKQQQFILKLLPRAINKNAQVIFDPEVQVLFELVD